MITLQFTTRKFQELKPGDRLHLRISKVENTSPGRWKLTVDDVTPLPGAEPLGYACGNCGIIESAADDGSLPLEWVVKEFQEGSKFLCPDCVDEPICRVCGCTEHNACYSELLERCHWVEEDLCSACVGKEGI